MVCPAKEKYSGCHDPDTHSMLLERTKMGKSFKVMSRIYNTFQIGMIEWGGKEVGLNCNGKGGSGRQVSKARRCIIIS